MSELEDLVDVAALIGEFDIERRDDGRRFVKLELKYPILVENEDVKELTILQPGPREFEAADAAKGKQIQAGNRILAACASIPYSSVMKMNGDDWNRCTRAVAALGLPTASQDS